MERKGGSTTVVVTADEVRAALSKAKSVSSEEEKVLRMRHGAAADLKAPLPRAAMGNSELADELMLIEMQLFRAARARTRPIPGTAGPVGTAAPVALATSRNRSRDKIVRALRKKRS